MSGGSSVRLDQWELRDFDPGAGPVEGGEAWLAVAAPGDTYLTLVNAGRLDHPYKARNEHAAAWVRDREWRWRTTFVAPEAGEGETVELVFDGLDTFATVYLDGAEIGRADNMFRHWIFSVGDRLRAGETHALEVRFDPTAVALEGKTPPPPWAAFTDRISRSKRNLMRKAQFGWGWDWGPDLPTVGVWKKARLEVRPRARIDDVAFTTLTATSARAETRIDVELSGTTAGLRTEIVLTDPQGRTAFRQERDAAETAPIPLTLDAPQLWWTHDLGAQPLYDLTVRLLDGDRLLDETTRAVGVRTIDLDQSPDPDEPGATFFRFVLNGMPIFAKGACWVPTTSFVADVASEPYDRLIAHAARANMNMIRVWGGGIYEPDLFYDLCDRKGVLIWQDFMFACAPYPDDDAFVASVRAEVDHQVRRLRHHPSMALWCGNNENEAIHRIDVDVSGVEVPLPGAVLYDAVVPGMLATLDPTTPYWPGSPGGGAHPNSMKAGDVHDWTVWHGIPPIPDDRMVEPFGYAPEKIVYQRYAEDTARFISEFGIQAAPALATLKRWMDPADLDPESEGFHLRIKDESKKALAMIDPVTGPPATLQDYIDFTQWTQAEGLKFGIEHFRRRRPHCSGALLWQFNDCWPCVSWSLIDYDGVEKAAYHAVRRAFAPVLASFGELGDGAVELWISNDTQSPVEDRAVIALTTLDGRAIWSEEVALDIPVDASLSVWSGVVPACDDQVLTVRSTTGAYEANRLLTVPVMDLKLDARARPVMTARVVDGALEVELSARVYLAFVHLVSDRADLEFSDNHFDLRAGETRNIRVTGASPVTAAEVSVRCWNDRIAEA
ncbi:glycosyl hydrolase 2 galactose-binding domain-containing protein [Brevundimonas sp.]|uniref:beta-mannosidase n=1 Tax=Brevundimonas sp. TaxID=1871086 RepID=UPI003D0B969E